MTTKDSETPNDKSRLSDGCPQWADKLIRQIRALEIQLGNIQPETEDPNWSASMIEKVYGRAFGDADDVRIDEEAIEILFNKVASSLVEAGHDPETIARFINGRITPEGRLPYCNAAEVRAALSQGA